MGKSGKPFTKLTILMYLYFLSPNLYAQKAILNKNYNGDSSENPVQILLLPPLNCKNPRQIQWLLPKENINLEKIARVLPLNRKRSISISGDISYDGNYHSYIDTPYNEKDVWQHNVLLNVLLTIKNIPIQFTINTRTSNSSFYKNFSDIGLQFDLNRYKEQMQEQVFQKITHKINSTFDTSLYDRLQTQLKEKTVVNKWLNDETQVQRLIESREIISLYKQKLADNTINNVSAPKLNSIFPNKRRFTHFTDNNYNNLSSKINDSITQPLNWEKLVSAARKCIEEYDSRKKEIESYSHSVDSIATVYQQQKDSVTKAIEEAKQAITNCTSYKGLKNKLEELGISKDSIPHQFKFLSGIKSFGLGRSIINYSELTLKNIAITGINAEYSNGIYIAVCGGAVDYRYRDFIIANFQMPRQNVAAFRIGLEKEKKSFIVTFYNGTKIYTGIVNSGNYSPVKNPVMGMSFEATYKLNQYTYLIAEMAKSTARYNPYAASNASKPVFKFNDHSSEAYAVKLFAKLPATNTTFTAQYKYMGINFQSFSFYANNSQMRQWSAKIDQYLFKRKLSLSGFIRNQGFENPYLPVVYKSNTIYKGITATLRLKKWPILSAGYLPVTQLISFNNQVQQINFQTVTATASYSRSIKGKTLSSTAIYSRFFNTAVDSGFAYYNASNISFSNSIIGNKTSFTNTVSVIQNNIFSLITIDQGASVKLGNKFELGGGIKLNRVNHIENKTGVYGNALIKIPFIGEFSMQYEYGYLPGYGQQKLIKNKTGQINYYRIF
jgi:hypothetical protein